jgi:hypothetical protein
MKPIFSNGVWFLFNFFCFSFITSGCEEKIRRKLKLFHCTYLLIF